MAPSDVSQAQYAHRSTGPATARRRTLLALMLTGAALAAPAPARAAADWNLGLPLEAFEESCVSIGNADIHHVEPNVSVRAGQFIDPQALPQVGEVFYGSVFIGQVRGCFEDFVIPEVVPPAGVELAISASDPVRCASIPSGGTQTPFTDGCPVAPGPGLYGGRSLAPGGDAANAWRLDPQEILIIEFPLRSSRPLTGLPGAPSCPERAAERGPCPTASAGDYLQTPVKVIDNGTSPTLTPAIGLFAVPAAGGAPAAGGGRTPGGTPRLLRAPRRARARAGVRITVRVPAAGATVTAQLRARGIRGVLARVRRRAVRAGELTLRLRPSRKARRALRRRGPTRATVRVTVRAPGRRAATATARVTLR